MKVLVIFTGGTIGSTLDHATIVPNSTTQSKLIHAYQEQCNDTQTIFETLTPFSILSENLQPSHWTTLIECLEGVSLSDYDGIIVTHGTDTLSYTANALVLTLGEFPLPLLLVSAHLPLEDPNSNAVSNFQAAVACIQHELKGIYACYQNPSEDFVSIFHACEVTQSLQLSSHFQALTGITGYYSNDTLSLHDHSQISRPSVSSKIKPFFSEELLYIKPYPGLNYEHFNLEGHTLVVHDLYHSGTCDTNRLKPFLRQCKRENILLLMAPLKKSDAYYETTQELMELGVHFIYDLSIEHILVKAMLALKNFSTHEEILDYLL